MKSKENKKPRRKYKPPQLIEYGTVKEMTKALVGSFPEGGGQMMDMA